MEKDGESARCGGTDGLTDVHRLTSLHAVPIIRRTRGGVLEHKQMNRAEE